MDSRERFLAALSGEQPDKVPIFELYINEPIIVKLARLLMPEGARVEAGKDRFGEERYEILDLYCAIIEKLGLDATSTNFSIGLEELSEELGRDRYGTIYRLSEHGEPMPIQGPIQDASDLKGFDLVSKLEPDDFAGPEYVIDKLGRSKAHIIVLTDPFKDSWRLRGGMQKLLMDFHLDPSLVHSLARLATDFSLAAVDMALKAGAEGVIVSGDLASEHTTIMSPAHFREYIKPYYREIVEHIHRQGGRIIKHSDGNIWPILDDLVEVGFDGLHPIQPQCMDIAEVKKHLAGRACLLGNIDCRNLLVFGSEGEVEEAVRETIARAAPGGSYILTSSNSIHPGCKPENFVAMVRAAHRYGMYS